MYILTVQLKLDKRFLSILMVTDLTGYMSDICCDIALPDYEEVKIYVNSQDSCTSSNHKSAISLERVPVSESSKVLICYHNIFLQRCTASRRKNT
jgi:hypothetical protein